MNFERVHQLSRERRGPTRHDGITKLLEHGHTVLEHLDNSKRMIELQGDDAENPRQSFVVRDHVGFEHLEQLDSSRNIRWLPDGGTLKQ